MPELRKTIIKDRQYFKFSLYGFLKNLRFYEPFLIIFLLQKGFTYLEIGSLYAIREVALNVFEIPSGIIADTLGRKWTLASTFLIYIVSFLIFSFAEGYLLFSVAMAFYALGDAARSGVNKALIIRYLEKTDQAHLKVDYYGHTRSWSQYGSALSSLVAGALVFFKGNLNGIFLFSIIPYLLDFFLVSSYPNNLDDHVKSSVSIKDRFATLGNTFKITIMNLTLLRAMTNTSIYTGLYKSMKDFIQPFLKTSLAAIPVLMYLNNEQKLSVLIGITYFLIFAASAISSRFAKTISEKLGGQRRVLNISLIVGAILGIISGVLMSSFLLPMLVVPLFIILIIIENLRKPAAVSEITSGVDNVARTSVLSILSQMSSIFAAVFVLLIGLIADSFNLGYGIAAVSAILLLSLPLSLIRSTR